MGANSIQTTSSAVINPRMDAANDSNKPVDGNNPIIKKLADEYQVNPGPLADGVNHLRSGLNGNDPIRVSDAISEITAALDPSQNGVAADNSEPDDGSNYDWGSETGSHQCTTSGGETVSPDTAQYQESWANNDSGKSYETVISEPPDDIDYDKLALLHDSLVKLGIDPTRIRMIIDQMETKMQDDLDAQRQARDAAIAEQQAAQQPAAQQLPKWQPSQNFSDNVSDVSLASGQHRIQANKVGDVGAARIGSGQGTDLLAQQPFIYEGKYSDGNIRSYFNKDNVDPSTGTVSFKNGQGGSFISQTPVGTGTVSFDYSSQTNGNVSAGGLFAYKAHQAEYDVGERISSDPMTFTVGVHDHAIGQKVYSQDVDMRKLGYTDPSQLRNIHMEAKIEKGVYEVRYQDASGKMQLVGSYPDDGKIYRQMYETPADNTTSGPNVGAKWQANIWSGEDNSSGSGSMTIANLRHVAS